MSAVTPAAKPETRIRGLNFPATTCTGPWSLPSSTLRWGSGFRCTTTASATTDNRYYSSTLARFTTPDPYRASGGPSDPQSWNRYAYVQNDPVNFNDPSGLFKQRPEDPLPVGYCYLNPLDPICRPGSMGMGGGPGDPGIADTPNGVAVNSLADIPPTDLARAYLVPAFTRALQALTLNTDCMNLFGNAMTREAGFNPALVLGSIVNGGSLGSISFVDMGSGWGVAQAGPAGWLPLPGLAGKVSITINVYNDADLYWNDADTDENARTLLHELGHAFNFLRGSGGFALRNGAERTDKYAFDKLIEEKCIPKH
jgi:RHS repeat-associated protein